MPRIQPKRRVASTKSIPSPVGGWNAQDAISDMPETDAVRLDNFFPNTTDVMLRKGSEDWVSGIVGKVETLAAYNNSTVSKLFAVTGDSVYDVSLSSSSPVAVVSSGITSGKWEHVNFGVPGGAQWLYMVNGKDYPMAYNGTEWIRINASSTPAITGVSSTDLIHINVFKRRIWFVQKNSTKAWYLPTDSIGGAAQQIDVGPLFTNGGHLVAMATWTIDAGEGMDDHVVFISSRGQIAVYSGTDPANAATFSLIGVFNIGAPIGKRCFIKYGGDLLVITRDGVSQLSQALISDRVNSKHAITNKIRYAMAGAVSAYGDNFGWQLQQYPDGNMLLLNVPISNMESHQYVMNTISGMWCRFIGWNASCWEIYKDDIFFGGDGFVKRAWKENNDSGSDIVGDVLPAFSYFTRNKAQLIRWLMARVIMSSSYSNPGVIMDMNVDFEPTPPSGTPTFTSSSSAKWDISKWDDSFWGGAESINKGWQTISGIGFAGSLHVTIASGSSEIRWYSTDFVFETGGTI